MSLLIAAWLDTLEYSARLLASPSQRGGITPGRERSDYRYGRLQRGSEIRLLPLHRKYVTGEIQCVLVPVRLKFAPSFEAVSYRWGDAGQRRYATTINGSRFWVSSTVHGILRGLQYSTEERLLWIDSICIYSYRTAMKRLGNLRFYASVFRGVSFCLGGEKLMLCAFKMYITYTPICASFITIFVQERERGRFNRARDGASRTPGRV